MITLTGKKVAEGIAVGRLTFYKRGKKEIRRIYVEDAKKEVLRFKKACEKAVQEIKELLRGNDQRDWRGECGNV